MTPNSTIKLKHKEDQPSQIAFNVPSKIIFTRAFKAELFRHKINGKFMKFILDQRAINIIYKPNPA